MMFVKRVLTATAVVVITVVLGGCQANTPAATNPEGGGAAAATPATGRELADKALAAVQAATSVTIQATGVNEDAQQQQLLVTGRLDGTNYLTQSSAGDVSYEFRVVDQWLYIKGSPAYLIKLGVDPADAAKMASKWMQLDAASEPAKNAANVTPATVLQAYTQPLNSDNLAPEIAKATIDGNDVFLLANVKDTSPDFTFAIAADGTWLPVQLTSTDLGEMVATFSDWNSADPVQAPPADQIITIPT